MPQQTYPTRPGAPDQLAAPVPMDPTFYEQFYLARAADLQHQDHQLATALRAQAQQLTPHPQPVYQQPPPYAPQPAQVIYTHAGPSLSPGVVKYCACSVATGAAVALGGWGLGQADHALVDLAHLVYSIAALGVVGAVLWCLFGIGGGSSGSGGGGGRRGSGDTYITHNHQQITGRGFLGRATGSITTNNGQ
ncbi:hypothetical protein ACEZCY_35920 [Streptacidiphilus sp. N1-12]|uniref:Uncharacterized protein n=1 Tax=Streptacidiphilus alkalitolerans TaxID=3342712 RepID=A0ABV6WSJ7_9ACTN